MYKFGVFLFLFFVIVELHSQDPKFLFEEDCNLSSECVNGVLTYGTWKLIKTKSSLWDDSPCLGKKFCKNFFFEFDSYQNLKITWVTHKKGKIINQKLVKNHPYKITKNRNGQYFLKILETDPYLGINGKQAKLDSLKSGSYEFQFLFNPKDHTLILRYNSSNPLEKSISHIFNLFIPK